MRPFALAGTLSIALAAALASPAAGQPFVEVPSAGLGGVQYSTVAWADFDGDADLDLVLTGRDNSATSTSRVYANDGSGTFGLVGAGLAGVEFGSTAWGDYDNDGDPDLLITGLDDFDTPDSRLYRNNGGTFTNVSAGFVGVTNSAVAWGDYDNDGDLDVCLAGRRIGNILTSRIYRNDSGSFLDIGAALPAVQNCAVAWGDYDNDRDLDLLIAGIDSVGNRISRVYANSAGTFANTGASLVGIERGTALWHDYDNDGDLDIALAGYSASGMVTIVLAQTTPGVFVDIQAAIRGVQLGSLDWGDFDNDGDSDLLVTGSDQLGVRVASVYRNDGATFAEAEVLSTPVHRSAARWGDIDNDGDLDIVLTGQDASGAAVAKVYRNDVGVANNNPTAPGTPGVQLVGTTATFAWVASSDTETPAPGLTYNIRVGTTPGGSQVASAMAIPVTGFRRVVQAGNAGHALASTLTLPNLGTYYWAVQTIDAGMRASSFTTEQRFSTSFTDLPTTLAGVSGGAVAWGDYDNDQDLDLVVLGNTGSSKVTQICRNDDGNFVVAASLEGVDQGAASWGDYDGDGDLDLALTGYTASSTSLTRIYRNNAGIFTDSGISNLSQVYRSHAAWGDYDNDGDLDLLVTGFSNDCNYVRIYRNVSGASFSNTSTLDGVSQGAASWVDYDKDGDLDVFVIGHNDCYGPIARFYRNDSGNFNHVSMGIEPVFRSSADWGDYDNDGDLDLLIAGYSNSYGRITRIYRNNSGSSFSDVAAALPGVDQGAARWGDYDSDGDLDVAISGQTSGGPLTRVYRNHAGLFSDTVAGLEALGQSALAWGDFNGDRQVDLAVTGTNAGSSRVFNLYQNNAIDQNAPPSPPSNLNVQVTGTTAVFSWDAALDDRTPSAGLSYNLRVGTTPGGSQVVPGMADATTGVLRVAQIGNANQRLSTSIALPQLGTYYWSVQAVDASYVGSDFAAERTFSTPFSDINAGIDGMTYSSVAWGDYDSDSDLDLLVAGYSNSSTRLTRLYRNDAGAFHDAGANLLGIRLGCVAWGDYDRDGDLDILLTGESSSGRITTIYRNDGGSFTNAGGGLPGLDYASAAWGDYNNDGNLDILLSGYSDSYGYLTRVYRNEGAGAFNNVRDLAGGYQGSVAWGDYDNDGDLDILLTGYSCWTRIYRNDNGSFNDIGANLCSDYQSSAVWGDYDNDGDLDILIAGVSCGSRIYRNDSGSFTNINAGLGNAYNGSVAWGDYDNDGRLDALVTGYGSSVKVYRNSGGTFVDMGASLPAIAPCAAAWGDYDNDGDLDLVVSGTSGQYISRIFRNNAASVPNSPPTAPTNLSVQVVGSQARLRWDRATDSTTPAIALSYNLRIGTSPGGSEVMSSMADLTTGSRRIVQLGSANSNASWLLNLSTVPVNSNLYFAVQAVDHAFAGSTFSSEAVFSGAPTITSVRDVPNDQGRQVRLRWQKSIYDAPTALTRIVSYAIYRLVESGANKSDKAAGRLLPNPKAPPRIATPPGTWDFVLSVPARGDESYSVVAPTLCDSTAAHACASIFFVSGLTSDPYVYFDSAPLGGHSIDNLSPQAPQSLVAAVQGASRVHLQWAVPSEEDFDYCAVYRDAASGFTPSDDNRIGVTTDGVFDDDTIQTGSTYYYVVTAFDFSGNQSSRSNEVVASVVPSDVPAASYRNALYQNGPNPFNPSTEISFELAAPARVRLEIFSATGERVLSLLDAEMGEGVHFVQWRGVDQLGRRVPSGQYLCRLIAGSFTATRKMVLVQ